MLPHGNSGGPRLSLEHRIASGQSSDVAEGLGFAIPGVQGPARARVCHTPGAGARFALMQAAGPHNLTERHGHGVRAMSMRVHPLPALASRQAM